MILTREEIKELYATGSLEVVVPKLPATETVRIQPAVGVAAVCIARIDDDWPHRDGSHVAVLGLSRRLKAGPQRVRKVREKPRFIKPGGGETSDPRQAMGDPAIPWDEEVGERAAEAQRIDKETERRFAQRAHQSHELRQLDQQRREVVERLDRALEGAERLGVDPTRHVAAFDRRLTDLEKKLKKAA